MCVIFQPYDSDHMVAEEIYAAYCLAVRFSLAANRKEHGLMIYTSLEILVTSTACETGHLCTTPADSLVTLRVF